jgi:predicted nucleotidyltransferase/HEPN domain-containing protein
MKISLDHLPPRKRGQLAAVVNEICAAVDVEMVILFGSHARGDWVEDSRYFSDLDVLVIVKSPKIVEQHDLWSAIEQRAARHAAPTELSLIVHDIDDVNRQLELGQTFFSDIVKEGIALYDAGRITLAEALEKSPHDRRRYARANFDAWFGSADDFMIAFDALVQKGRYNIAAFQLQKAAERYYTAALLVLSEYKPKSHNLDHLDKRAAALAPSLRGVFPRRTPKDARLFKLLTRAYIDARHPTELTITEADLLALARWVRDLRERVMLLCRERIGETSTLN